MLPGSVRTENRIWTRRREGDRQIYEKLVRWCPPGRDEPGDVANAVAILGSDEAACITGVALPVDGGLLAGMNIMIEELVLECERNEN